MVMELSRKIKMVCAQCFLAVMYVLKNFTELCEAKLAEVATLMLEQMESKETFLVEEAQKAEAARIAKEAQKAEKARLAEEAKLAKAKEKEAARIAKEAEKAERARLAEEAKLAKAKKKEERQLAKLAKKEEKAKNNKERMTKCKNFTLEKARNVVDFGIDKLTDLRTKLDDAINGNEEESVDNTEETQEVGFFTRSFEKCKETFANVKTSINSKLNDFRISTITKNKSVVQLLNQKLIQIETNLDIKLEMIQLSQTKISSLDCNYRTRKDEADCKCGFERKFKSLDTLCIRPLLVNANVA